MLRYLAVPLARSQKSEPLNMKNKDIFEPFRGSSFGDLPWDRNREDKFESLLDDTASEWYEAKHGSPTVKEILLINALEIPDCPWCGSSDFIRYGMTHSGIRRYLCRDCRRTFVPLTQTLFDSKRIPMSEWMEYLFHLMEFHSLVTSARDNRNARSTGKYWLLKLFDLLDGYQDSIAVSGRVWIDETMFPVVESDRTAVGGRRLRGISRNLTAAGCATDGIHTFLVSEGTSKPSMLSTWRAYGSRILPGSTVFHDGEHSHGVLFRRIPGLKDAVFPSEETKGLKDFENPLYPINHIHMLAKRFIGAHGGYGRSHLQDWLNLLAYILNPPFSRIMKVRDLLQMAVFRRRRMKYRDVMSKKR